MKRIILIQPRIPIEEGIHDKPSLPLALLTLAAPLVKEFDVKIIDQRLHVDNWKNILKGELLAKSAPLCMGITTMTGRSLKYVMEIINFSKKIAPKVPIILGGIHSTLCTDETINHQNVDFVVRGEGDETFKELVYAIKNKSLLKSILGLSWKNNGKIIHNKKRPLIKRLDNLPPIPYNIVDVNNYLQTRLGKKTIIIQTSRGCPWRCGYCYVEKTYNRKIRFYSPQRVLDQVKFLKDEYGVEYVILHDDEAFIDVGRSMKIIQGLNKIGLGWETSGARVDSISRMSDDQLRIIERGGRRLYLGVESGSQRILDEIITKDLKLEKVVELNRRLVKFPGIMPHYNFIAGTPTETRKELKESIKLACQLLEENPNARITAFFTWTFWPGNRLYEKHFPPKLRPKSLEEWANYDFDRAPLPYLSKKERKDLQLLYVISRMMDNKLPEYIRDGTIRNEIKIIAWRLYKPIAWFRFKHLFLRFGRLERWIYKKMSGE